MCEVACAMAAMNGLMSCRGHWMPYSIAASMEPCQVSGMPTPSPKNSMSTPPRSAAMASSVNIPRSG